MASLVKSGVLVLTHLPKSTFLQKIIAEAVKCVNNTLYVDLLTTSTSSPAKLPAPPEQAVTDKSEFYSFMSAVYKGVSTDQFGVDVRVLLPPANLLGKYPRATMNPVELCIGNTSSIRNLIEFEHIVSRRLGFYHVLHGCFQSLECSKLYIQKKQDLEDRLR